MNHTFAVIDTFTKFVWLNPKTFAEVEEIPSHLEVQKSIFGNLSRIISVKGAASTAKASEDPCTKGKILKNRITTGLQRANDQVEHLNCVIKSVS